MTMSKQLFEEEQERLMAITAMGMEVKALILDDDGEVISADDPDAERLLYASVFQAWADNKIEGTAEQVFETIQEALDL